MRCGLASLGLLTLAVFGCEGVDSEPVVGSGMISLVSTRTAARGGASYRRFWAGGSNCPRDLSVGDNCAYSNCAYNLDDIPALQSAGAIQIDGGLHELLLTPSADGGYLGFMEEGPLFEGNEAIHFEVAGEGEIEAAAGTVVAPRFVELSEPEFTEITEIDRAEDLSIRWVPLSDANVVVSASVLLTDGRNLRTVSFYCSFSGWLGAASLASQELQRLPATTDGGEGTFWVGTQATGFDRKGGWEHVFSLTAYDTANVTFR